MKELKVKVRGLAKSFGSLEVLKSIDLDVYEGDVICIIGPSGSGKSTFLRCLNLLEQPNAGSVEIEGKDINNLLISLDENNKLKAKIVDTETGASSKSSITLVSRTIEERLQMDDYTISDSKLSSAKKVAAGAGIAIAGGGLLAKVNAALKEKNESEQKISEPAEEQTESIENTSNNEEEFSVDDIYVEPEFDESSVIEEPSQVLEETSISEDELTNIEQTNENTEESSEIEEPAFEDATEIFEETTNISDDLPNFEETTNISEDLSDFEESTSISEDLPDFEESTNISEDLSDFEETSNISEEMPDFEETTTISDDLSNFDDVTLTDDELSNIALTSDITEENSLSDELPDFEEKNEVLEKQGLLAHAESLLNDEFSDENGIEENTNFLDDFDLPDFDENETTNSILDDDFDSIYQDEILTNESHEKNDIFILCLVDVFGGLCSDSYKRNCD